jgi:hypothetical protein
MFRADFDMSRHYYRSAGRCRYCRFRGDIYDRSGDCPFQREKRLDTRTADGIELKLSRQLSDPYAQAVLGIHRMGAGVVDHCSSRSVCVRHVRCDRDRVLRDTSMGMRINRLEIGVLERNQFRCIR